MLMKYRIKSTKKLILLSTKLLLISVFRVTKQFKLSTPIHKSPVFICGNIFFYKNKMK